MTNTVNNLNHDMEEETNAEIISDANTKEKKSRREKTSRPLRRYGIEVDKIEDVGVTVMCDGIYPSQCMTMEEYLSIPQEVRDKANAEMDNFFKNSKTTFPAVIKEAIKNQLAGGNPIIYGEENKVLKRYPDGRIFSAIIDKNTYEITETFLRMATSEDDYWER